MFKRIKARRILDRSLMWQGEDHCTAKWIVVLFGSTEPYNLFRGNCTNEYLNYRTRWLP
jgi:hypothetical protein